ncbi:MAG: helix-turn-helix domain-containing protein [Victivallales bacterium]|nr:helix-turn-helix domain-containing protein [Victivallales bacterium]
MNSNESLWNADDVGKYLNISRDTVYRWINKKQMPATRIGKKWLFRKNEIDVWLNNMDRLQKETVEAKGNR